MKIQVLKEKLQDALQKAQVATGKNTTTPILKCFHIETKENSLIVRATNLDLGVEITIPVKVEVEGSVVVLASTLVSFIGSLDSEKNITLEATDDVLRVSSSKSSSVLKVLNKDEFPLIPKDPKQNSFELDAGVFVKGLRAVSYSASVSSIKPELSSVLIYPEEQNLVFVATDSFRLAEKKVNIKKKLEFEQILIPLKNVNEIVRLLEDKKEIVEVSFNKNQISFAFDGFYIVSRVVDGVFPAYQQIIPKESKTEASFIKKDFVNALKTAHIFSDTFNRVTFLVNPENKTLEIKTKNNELGENNTSLLGSLEGEGVELSFNYKNISDCIGTIDSDNIKLSFDGANKPLIIKGVGDPSFFYLAMPMNR